VLSQRYRLDQWRWHRSRRSGLIFIVEAAKRARSRSHFKVFVVECDFKLFSSSPQI
jgi:hypothetical protein